MLEELNQVAAVTGVSQSSSASNALKSLAFIITSREAIHAEIMRPH